MGFGFLFFSLRAASFLLEMSNVVVVVVFSFLFVFFFVGDCFIFVLYDLGRPLTEKVVWYNLEVPFYP